ncbi:MAG TPA: protein kinase, partial [Kofleriaceae bacterium]|nr:protein kinase [Kofleriaceae bacterium]
MVTPAQPSRRFLGQSDKLGKYEVIRQIAVGGMAELYLARTVGMEGFEKLVCVKRILPQYINNPSFVNMFLNEARLAATLHHPNVAQVYDIGQEQGEFFFAMEYVHGEDLGRLVATAQENGVAVSLDCALTVASGLCAGLHHAHEKASPDGKPLGVVHRDVSPTNVLVSYDGAVKLVDFGIARAGGTSVSTTGLKGKIAYMSPEQCRGKVPLDRRSDVFSIGTILYELTTGRRPFVDETEYGVLQQIVNRDADPPSSVAPGYPPALEAIVMRALSRDVERRFSTALELQNQLEDFAHDNRLRVSPLVLARLMSTLFPARLEEWDHARAQGAFFVEQHVVRTLIESGKTPDAAAGYLPQPLPPPADDASEAALAEAPTVPAGRGSAPNMATQIGLPPVAQQRMGPQGQIASAGPMTPVPGHGNPGGHMPPPQRPMTPLPVPMAQGPRSTPAPGQLGPGQIGPGQIGPGAPMMTPVPGHMTPPPGEMRSTSPVLAAGPVSQPRLPTPPPLPGVAPLPGVRYAQMPVPNMPGAVPIVTAPMMGPPIASAGTLVSSAIGGGIVDDDADAAADRAGRGGAVRAGGGGLRRAGSDEPGRRVGIRLWSADGAGRPGDQRRLRGPGAEWRTDAGARAGPATGSRSQRAADDGHARAAAVLAAADRGGRRGRDRSGRGAGDRRRRRRDAGARRRASRGDGASSTGGALGGPGGGSGEAGRPVDDGSASCGELGRPSGDGGAGGRSAGGRRAG